MLKQTDIAQRYADLEMIVRDRTEDPKVVTREHFCPGCAASLGVDVTTEDLETLPAPQALLLFAALTFVSLTERGVPFWAAFVVTFAAMVIIGIAIERSVLRPLTNKPPITASNFTSLMA